MRSRGRRSSRARESTLLCQRGEGLHRSPTEPLAALRLSDVKFLQKYTGFQTWPGVDPGKGYKSEDGACVFADQDFGTRRHALQARDDLVQRRTGDAVMRLHFLHQSCQGGDSGVLPCQGRILNVKAHSRFSRIRHSAESASRRAR